MNRAAYPETWDLIAARIKDRAGWRCTACGQPHGPVPNVLTVHHLNGNPEDCRDANLIALCQRDHLRAEHLKPRPTTKEACVARLIRRIVMDKSQLPLPVT
jgi:hypothetical protein